MEKQTNSKQRIAAYGEVFSQDITKDRFSFVPIQDFTKSWNDEDINAKYDLNGEEIAFINSMIRPMGSGGDDDDE